MKRYPYFRVILGSTFLGGALSIFWWLVFLLYASLQDGFPVFQSARLEGILLLSILLGIPLALMGMASTFLSGLWLALVKAYRNTQGLLHAVASMVLGVNIMRLVLAFVLEEPVLDTWKVVLSLSLIAGASGFALGAKVLPQISQPDSGEA